MIEKIRFKNFKLFKNWQALELRPITVIIGKNNSGKSAIVKLPTLLSGSLSGDFLKPLKIENRGISLGLSYEDLVYNRNIVDSLEIELFTAKEKLLVALYGDRQGQVNFSKFNFNGKNANLLNTSFRGFTIVGKPFESLSINYDYVGPFRIVPSPYYSDSGYEHEQIGIQGKNAYPILIQNNGTRMFGKISDWYKENFEGWGLKISQISGSFPSYEVALEKTGINPINMVNVGQGIHQVLPLIVRSYLPLKKETLIIIEEPETHLHPAAHGNLAQRFVESYLEDNKRNYLIETHSHNFVLRLRRLVAENILSKDDLAIYYVDFDEENNESTLELIEIDKNGGIPRKNWPAGIFSETTIETRAIYNAQLNDSANVDRN